MIVYIAGPYSSKSDNELLGNIMAARDVAVKVWQSGHFAICPHLNTAFMSGICDEAQFYAGDLEILKRCDAVVTVPGWKESAGSKFEIVKAQSLDIPIYHSVCELKEANNANHNRKNAI